MCFSISDKCGHTQSVIHTLSESFNRSDSCSTQPWTRESLAALAIEHHAVSSPHRLRNVRAAASRTPELEWNSKTVLISAIKVDNAWGRGCQPRVKTQKANKMNMDKVDCGSLHFIFLKLVVIVHVCTVRQGNRPVGLQPRDIRGGSTEESSSGRQQFHSYKRTAQIRAYSSGSVKPPFDDIATLGFYFLGATTWHSSLFLQLACNCICYEFILYCFTGVCLCLSVCLCVWDGNTSCSPPCSSTAPPLGGRPPNWMECHAKRYQRAQDIPDIQLSLETAAHWQPNAQALKLAPLAVNKACVIIY